MANPAQEIVVISTNESDSDNKDEVAVNMELKQWRCSYKQFP